MLIVMYVVFFFIGELYIDGEFGDLKFIIRELWYCNVDFKVFNIIILVVLVIFMIVFLF